MGAVMAGSSDFPYGDLYTNSSNYIRSNIQGVNGTTFQVGGASLAGAARSRLSSTCMQSMADVHNREVYDAYVEMGSSTTSVEAQELAGVLRGILDGNGTELLCTAIKHDLPAPSPAEKHLISLASPFNLVHSSDHHHESASSLNSTQHYIDIENEEELSHNHAQVANPILNCMSSTCSDSLLSELSLLNYNNHQYDNANHGSNSFATSSKPMYRSFNGLVLRGISGKEESNYGLSSSLSQEVANHEEPALKKKAENCSDNHDNFTEGSKHHSAINACKELHTQPCTEPYQMVGDHDRLTYPSGMLVMQREAMYAAAAMQPVDWVGILAVSAGTRPKRRNVRISHDPQTASARRRRERISDRIRILQRLVPGGTKMDTASMLDEAIQYLKFLKSQVQALQWLEIRRSSPLSSSSSSCFYPSAAASTHLPKPS